MAEEWRKRKEGNRCVLGGCSNTSCKGFSVYQMPSEPLATRQAWTRFIRSTRMDFYPDTYSKVFVCSGHFLISNFDETHVNMYKSRFRKNPPALKKNAVPTQTTAVNPFPANFFTVPTTESTEALTSSAPDPATSNSAVLSVAPAGLSVAAVTTSTCWTTTPITTTSSSTISISSASTSTSITGVTPIAAPSFDFPMVEEEDEPDTRSAEQRRVSKRARKKVVINSLAQRCVCCVFTTIDTATLDRHYKEQHPSYVRMYRCNNSGCEYESNKTCNLRRHLRTCKLAKKMGNSDHTGTPPKKISNLFKVDVSSMLRPLYCKYCPLSFRKLDAYRRHIVRHKKKYKNCQPKTTPSLVSMVNLVIHIISSADQAVAPKVIPSNSGTTCKVERDGSYKVERNSIREVKVEGDAVCTIEGDAVSKVEGEAVCKVTRNAVSKVKRKAVGKVRRKNLVRPYKCKLCSKSYVWKPDLTRHVKKHHTESYVNDTRVVSEEKTRRGKKHKKRHTCKYCHRTFARAQQLWGHVRVHSEAGKNYGVKKGLRCCYCPQRFSYRCDLSKHLTKHTGEKRFQCPHCERYFNKNSHLQTHIQNQTQYMVYGCPLCNQKFASKCQLNVHTEKHHVMKVEEQDGDKVARPLHCPMCTKRFTEHSHLTQHISRHHRLVTEPRPAKTKRSTKSKSKMQTCQSCHKCFKKRKYLVEHLKRMHHTAWKHYQSQSRSRKRSEPISNLVEEARTENNYRCPKCSKSYTHKNSLIQHMRRINHKSSMSTGVSSKREISAWKQCRSRSLSRKRSEPISNLVEEVRTENNHQCPKCTKTYTHRNSLIQHMRRNNHRSSISTGVPSKREISTKHLKVEAKDRPFECEYCSKSFVLARNLEMHMLKHEVEDEPVQYKCGYCLEGFTERSELSRHMISNHMGEEI